MRRQQQNRTFVHTLVAALFWIVAATELVLGDSVSGDLMPGGDYQSGSLTRSQPECVYRLQISKAGIFRIETQGYTQVRLELFRPDQRDKPYDDDAAPIRENSPDLVNLQLTVRLHPGEYFARVRHARPGGAGEFRIRLVAVDDRTAKEEPLLPPIDTSKKSGKLALLVGIDQYDSVSDLRGCVNDALDLQDLLVSHFGFTKDDILILKDGEATHSNIIEVFNKHLIERAEPDAVIVFHFSGHGSQMRDQPGGDEADGYDETIVPADSRVWGKYDIRDDELNGLFRKLSIKTKNVTFVLDSCHSGTGVKGKGLARRIPRDDRSPPPAQDWEFSASRGIPEKEARFENEDYVLLAGCRDEELSFELELNGLYRGAMTYYLTREIRETNRGGVTYQEIMQRVAANVTRENPSQNPQFEGRVDRQLFSGLVFRTDSVPAPAYVLASREGDEVVLQAGRVHGLTPGTTFNVFRSDEPEWRQPDKRTARVELTAVDTLFSKARLVDGDLASIRPMSWAVEHERAYSFEPFPVRLLDPHVDEDRRYLPEDAEKVAAWPSPATSGVLKAVAGWLDGEESPHHQQAGRASEARLLIADDGSRLRILRTSGDEVPYESADYSEDWAISRIRDWAKWHNLLAIENRQSKSLQVKVDIRSVNGLGQEIVTDAASSVSRRFQVGEEVRISVTNEGAATLYYVLVNISSDGTATVIHPGSKQSKALLSGRQEDMKPTPVQLPDTFSRLTDCLKVIATSQPADFGFLEIEGLQARGSDNPLTRLFAEAAGQTASKGTSNVGFEDWATAEVWFEVTR